MRPKYLSDAYGTTRSRGLWDCTTWNADPSTISRDAISNPHRPFRRNFEVQYDSFGQQSTTPLIPGGSSIAVTGSNRALYVERLVDWTLKESVESQFSAFSSGFHQVRVCTARESMQTPGGYLPGAIS